MATELEGVGEDGSGQDNSVVSAPVLSEPTSAVLHSHQTETVLTRGMMASRMESTHITTVIHLFGHD